VEELLEESLEKISFGCVVHVFIEASAFEGEQNHNRAPKKIEREQSSLGGLHIIMLS